MSGKVYLVGAGPGDPGLITLKGLECIQRSDAIIYDYLVSSALLKNAKAGAELIYVGKKSGDHTLPQERINDLILEKATQGLTVTRLKGGDPFIFGRGGEEAEVLVGQGIDFEIVPGVTSAIAAPAYAGIPLTHREFTSSVAFVTGHEDPSRAESRIDWAALAKGIGTLVFLMGVGNLPQITRKLMENGKSEDTPAALVQWGTTPRQTTVTGTLGTIVEIANKAGITSPAIIIVGEVVRLRSTLKWFEKAPLLGKTIIVTRAREQASDMVRILSDWGASCLEFPTIEVGPPDDWEPLDTAIKNLHRYDWIAFTSVNGVTYFFERLFHNGLDVRALNALHTTTVGPATEKALSDHGIKSDIIPESYRGESVAEAFKDQDMKGKRILLPRATEARPVLPDELRKMGAGVDDIPAYCTRAAEGNKSLLLEHLKNKTVDMVTFTSSSTVKNFRALLPDEQFEDLMSGLAVASIGPVTTDTAIELGFKVHITADPYTIPDLCKAIVKFYQHVK